MDKTLLIGNGLNRTLKSSISWEDLLDDIANEYGVEHIDNLPMPLEFERIVNTILRKSSNPSSRIYNDIKKKIANKVQDIKLPADAIQHELCAIPVNAIITTNYDYLLENAYNQDFSYKDAKDKHHVCPNCGYIFDDEIFDLVRSNYGALNEDYMCQQIQLLINSVSEKLDSEKKKYVDLSRQMKVEEKAFQAQKDEFDIYIRRRGLAASAMRFQKQLDRTTLEIQKIEEDLKEINKELRKLPNKKEVEEKYVEYVRLNIMALGAWNPSYEGKIHLLKPIKAQGTLENKIILAQFVAIFQTMEYFKTSATRFSFVVDSPRAKEASASSSKDILKMIAQMKMLPQVILATINYSEYKPEIEIPANIITLSEKGKLLREDDYTKKRDMIRGIHELLK